MLYHYSVVIVGNDGNVPSSDRVANPPLGFCSESKLGRTCLEGKKKKQTKVFLVTINVDLYFVVRISMKCL